MNLFKFAVIPLFAVFYLSGALCAQSLIYNLRNSTGSGAAFYVDSDPLFDITASTIMFRNNSAQQSAGAIYASNSSNVSMTGSYIEFVGNTGRTFGGAVHGSTDTKFVFDVDMVVFENNSAKNNAAQYSVGGAVYAADAEFVFNSNNVSFFSNDALGSGGAVFARDNSIFTFNSMINTFAGNESAAGGGAIYSQSGSQFTFSGNNTYFDSNESITSGGAVDASGGSVLKFSSVKTNFQYNKSSNGGAVRGNDSSFTFDGDELFFTGNRASSYGGAVYAENNAVFDFSASANVFRYNSASSGGAIYMAGSDIAINNAVFLNNTASGFGGAVYMDGVSASDSAELKINALTADALFSGNTASGKANDIYMNKYANIEFFADAGRKITLEGGISAKADLGNSIVKTGTGILEFGGNYLGYKGDLKISAGTLSVINDAAVMADKFEIEAGAVYSAVNGRANQATKVGSAQVNGELNIDVDFASYKADKIIADSSVTSAADGLVNLDVSSILNIASAGSLGIGTSRITLIEAENGVTGTFASENFTSIAALFPAGTTAFIEYLANRVNLYVSRTSSFSSIVNMTHNQKSIASAFDEISKANTTAAMSEMLTKTDALANDSLKTSALDQVAGSFIANALTAGALRNGMTELYERIQQRYCPHESKISESLWGQLYLSNNKYDKDENSSGDFTANGYGIQAGFDLLTGQNSLGGLYISYGNNDMEQGYDKASMQDYSLGFYGGWFGETADIKGSVSGAIQSFDLKRNIKFAGLKTNADFNTYNIRADGQIEFKIGLGSGALELRPFAGLQGGYVINDKIEEKNGGAANLIIESGDYLRLTGLGGVGIGTRTDKFSWYGKLYAGYIIAGTQNEFDAKFEGYSEELNIFGTELGAFGGGAGIGAEYNLTKQWSLYANANAGLADGSSGYYANIGVNYAFCKDVSRTHKAAKKEDNSEIVQVVDEDAPFMVAPVKEEKAESVKIEPYTESLRSEDNNKVSAIAAEPAAPASYAYISKPEPQQTYTAPVAKQEIVKPVEAAPVIAEAEPFVRTSDEQKPVFEETAAFVPANHELGDAEKEVIKQQAQELKKKGYKKIVVRGHTDSTGDEAVNNTLSLQRAKAVREELIANGIDPKKVEYVGYADRKPVASNATENGMAMNRRTDIVVDQPAITPGAIYTASYFMTDAATLPADIKAKIKEQADEIKQINYSEIKVDGHADSSGNDSINDPLSKQRAKTIYDEFIRNGIDPDKMTYVGYGSKRPIDTNGTKEGRASNRRVEVTVK